MKKEKIALLFNNHRGLELYKCLKKKFEIDIYISYKNLNIKILDTLWKNKVIFIKKFNTRLINKIKNKKYFLLITAGFPLKLTKELISLPSSGVLNLHAGPLPSYKGGSVLNWQIINNVKKIELNVQKMHYEINTGPIYSTKSFKLKFKDNISTVHKKANKLFPKMTLEAIRKIKKNIKPKKQKNVQLSKIFKQRNPDDGKIIWKQMNSLQVYNLVRAITKPYPGAYYFNIKKVKKIIYDCKISKYNPAVKPGTEFKINGKLYIKCKRNSIQLINF